MGGQHSKSPSYWRPDATRSNCELCEAQFKFFRRRHHCRSCGGIFCDQCTKTRSAIPQRGINAASRICNICRMRTQLPMATASGGNTPRGSAARRRSDMVFGSDEKTLGPPVSLPRYNSAPDSPFQRTPSRLGTPSKISSTKCILSPIRRETLVMYLWCLKKELRLRMPKSVGLIIMEFLSQAFFVASTMNGINEALGFKIGALRCGVCFSVPERPVAINLQCAYDDEGLQVEGAENEAGKDSSPPMVHAPLQSMCHIEQTLPPTAAVSISILLECSPSKMTVMELGLVHETFISKRLLPLNGGKQKVGNFLNSCALHDLTSTRIPLLAIDPFHGVVIDSADSVEPRVVEKPLSWMVSAHWDGQSRSAVMVVQQVQASASSNASAALMGVSQNLQLTLPTGVAGRWHLAWSCATDSMVNVHVL